MTSSSTITCCSSSERPRFLGNFTSERKEVVPLLAIHSKSINLRVGSRTHGSELINNSTVLEILCLAPSLKGLFR